MTELTGPWPTLKALFDEIYAWAETVEGTIYAADDPVPTSLTSPRPRIGWRVVPKDPNIPPRRWSVTVPDLVAMRQRERLN